MRSIDREFSGWKRMGGLTIGRRWRGLRMEMAEVGNPLLTFFYRVAANLRQRARFDRKEGSDRQRRGPAR